MHVVITGASSGIGEALAREYVKRGASLTPIVDVASMAGIASTPGMYFYNASKGLVATPMETKGRSAYESTAAARWSPVGSAPVLARMIVNGVESKRARIIYPSMYALSRHFPNLTRWALDHLTPPIKAFAPAEERPMTKPAKP